MGVVLAGGEGADTSVVPPGAGGEIGGYLQALEPPEAATTSLDSTSSPQAAVTEAAPPVTEPTTIIDLNRSGIFGGSNF